MSETVALPELDVTDEDRKADISLYPKSHRLYYKAPVSDLIKLACRERQLRTAITRAELAEAKLAKRDVTLADLRLEYRRVCLLPVSDLIKLACRERQLLKAIARAELAEAKLEDEAWISVSDRLPLVVDHLLEYKGGNERHFCVGYWNRIVRCWIVNAESCPRLAVTHWRPLPPPPEEATAHSTAHSLTETHKTPVNPTL